MKPSVGQSTGQFRCDVQSTVQFRCDVQLQFISASFFTAAGLKTDKEEKNGRRWQCHRQLLDAADGALLDHWSDLDHPIRQKIGWVQRRNGFGWDLHCSRTSRKPSS